MVPVPRVGVGGMLHLPDLIGGEVSGSFNPAVAPSETKGGADEQQMGKT